MSDDDAVTGNDRNGEPTASHDAHGPSLPVRSDVSAVKLIGTLALAGAIAGLLIVVVFQWAQPRILAHQAEVLRAAVLEVLGAPAHYETLFVVGDELTADLPVGADSSAFEQVFLGFAEDGSPAGFAIVGQEPGFQDVIRLIFGYDPVSGRILGMKVLESKETPGLGDKIEKDSSFVSAFAGTATPLEGVKRGAGRGTAGEIDLITGATISSRAVISIINQRLEQLDPLLERYRAEGTK